MGLREPIQASGVMTRWICDVAAMWALRHGSELRIVSAQDHRHAPNSLHYDGLAVDFWADDMPALARWMDAHGLRVFWDVPGHYAHVHADAGG